MSLKREIEDKTSPLRTTLDRLLPGLAAYGRPLWRHALAGADLHADPALPSDVLGHAIGERVAAEFTGTSGWPAGVRPLRSFGVAQDVVADLAELGQRRAGELGEDRAARVACLLGLADRAFRTGGVDEPWYEGLLQARTLDEALEQVPDPWVHDVVAVASGALAALEPLAAGTPVVRGPVFAGSHLVGGADGDLILGPALVEVKAVRSNGWLTRTMMQVISYALLDFDDEYALGEVAILSARYGRLVRFDLDDVAARAGTGASWPELREQVRAVLEGPRRQPPGRTPAARAR